MLHITLSLYGDFEKNPSCYGDIYLNAIVNHRLSYVSSSKIRKELSLVNLPLGFRAPQLLTVTLSFIFKGLRELDAAYGVVAIVSHRKRYCSGTDINRTLEFPNFVQTSTDENLGKSINAMEMEFLVDETTIGRLVHEDLCYIHSEEVSDNILPDNQGEPNDWSHVSLKQTESFGGARNVEVLK